MSSFTLKCPRFIYLGLWVLYSTLFLSDYYKGITNRGSVSLMMYIFVGLSYVVVSSIWIWSYYVCCWGDPGSLYLFYKNTGLLAKIRNENIPRALKDLPLCKKCGLPKPERCHHCSECNACHFRFDHHCPVIGNCVALNNMKGFILMPIYGGVLLIVYGWLLAIHYGLIFAILVFPFCFAFIGMGIQTCCEICSNKTTLEKIGDERVSTKSYSQGWISNYKEIFSGFWGSILPTPPSVSGFYWSGIDENDLLDNHERTPLL